MTKNRGHFPNDDAVVKLLWLAICNIEGKRARAREKEKGGSRETKRKAEGRLVEGQTTTNWKQALAQLSMVYPDRINQHLSTENLPHLHRKLDRLTAPSTKHWPSARLTPSRCATCW